MEAIVKIVINVILMGVIVIATALAEGYVTHITDYGGWWGFGIYIGQIFYGIMSLVGLAVWGVTLIETEQNRKMKKKYSE